MNLASHRRDLGRTTSVNSVENSFSAVIGGTVGDFRRHWKQLFLTDLIYKGIAFTLLTPLVAILFRILVAASGDAVLADQDILYFLLGPLGWLCMITVGALWIGIVAIELAAMMAILATTGQQHIGLLDALRVASIHASRVSQVTARMVTLTLLAAAPFLAVAAVVYFALLTEFDFNYYLKERPPVFLVSVAIGSALVVTFAAVLLRFSTGWFYALPLVLFEDISPSKALRVSRDRADGHRRSLLLWIVGWALTTFVLSTLATAAIVGLARFFVPQATSSLALLAIAVGTSLLLWTVVSLAVNLLSTTTFASLYFNIYRKLGSDGQIDSLRLNIANSTAAHTHRGFRFTRKGLFAAGIMGAIVAIGVGVVAVRSVRLVDDVEIMAHRGSSAAAPENTMAAIKMAIEDRADWVEIDVQETADGEIVVFHDSDFMKLSGVDLKIWNTTTADLHEIDIGSWFGAEFVSERVPTLGEVLDQCKGKIGVNIELKYYGHNVQLEQRVAEIVELHEMSDNIMTMSLKIDAVRKMRSLRPRWRSGLLMSVLAGNLNGIDADFLAVNAGFVDRKFIRDAHANGKKVYVWTVNDPTTMSAMIGRGVDGLITDEPALARSVLAQRAKMSVPERLLIELADDFGLEPEIGEQ